MWNVMHLSPHLVRVMCFYQSLHLFNLSSINTRLYVLYERSYWGLCIFAWTSCFLLWIYCERRTPLLIMVVKCCWKEERYSCRRKRLSDALWKNEDLTIFVVLYILIIYFTINYLLIYFPLLTVCGGTYVVYWKHIYDYVLFYAIVMIYIER